MAKLPYAQRMADTKVMADGIREMKDNLPIGVQVTDAEKLDKLKSQVEALNSQQESAKATLKNLTEQLNKKEDELEKLRANLRKRIKLDIDQSLWKRFGIDDKR